MHQYLGSSGSTLGLGHTNTLGSLRDLRQGSNRTVVAVGIGFTALLLVALFLNAFQVKYKMSNNRTKKLRISSGLTLAVVGAGLAATFFLGAAAGFLVLLAAMISPLQKVCVD